MPIASPAAGQWGDTSSGAAEKVPKGVAEFRHLSANYLERAYALGRQFLRVVENRGQAMAITGATKAAPMPSPRVPLKLVGDVTRVPTRTLRRRSLANLLRMGHCAPTVMQTLLDASNTEAAWLVKLTAGLPGGIGNTGAECGGVTAPMILIGLRHARDAMHDGLPPVIDKVHDLLQRFAGCHGTMLCREIRGTDRLPLRCVGVVRQAPELCAQTLSTDCAHVIPPASRDAYRRLYAHFVERGFHCAHAVLQQVRHTKPVR